MLDAFLNFSFSVFMLVRFWPIMGEDMVDTLTSDTWNTKKDKKYFYNFDVVAVENVDKQNLIFLIHLSYLLGYKRRIGYTFPSNNWRSCQAHNVTQTHRSLKSFTYFSHLQNKNQICYISSHQIFLHKFQLCLSLCYFLTAWDPWKFNTLSISDASITRCCSTGIFKFSAAVSMLGILKGNEATVYGNSSGIPMSQWGSRPTSGGFWPT